MSSHASPPPGKNMGDPAPRYEAREKVTGKARYASDEPVDRPAYAWLVTSAIAKGSIEAIDEALQELSRACLRYSLIKTQPNSSRLIIRLKAAGRRRPCRNLVQKSSTMVKSLQ